MELKKVGEVCTAVTKIATVFVSVSFGLGFFMWTIYLSALGFSADNLFQTRFVLTGVLFLLSSLFVLKILRFLGETWSKGSNYFTFSGRGINHLLRSLVFFVVWLLLFVFIVFPWIPAQFGGGYPKAVALVGSREEIDYLGVFGIERASDVQTVPLCYVYEDDSSIILILNDRILSLKKNLYKGFVSLPSVEINKFRKDCNLVVLTNLFGLRNLIISN